MNWLVITLLLVGAIAIFAWQIHRRWRLMRLARMRTGSIRSGTPPANMAVRLRPGADATLLVGGNRPPGHLLRLHRAGVSFGRALRRGFSESFSLWGILSTTHFFGQLYSFTKDTFVILVILGVLVFFYYRIVKRLGRMTLSFEGLLILLIIFTMMNRGHFLRRVAPRTRGDRGRAPRRLRVVRVRRFEHCSGAPIAERTGA